MKPMSKPWIAVVLIALSLAAAGCAKKQAETPPTPAPTPPAPAPTPPPPPPPTPEPAPPPAPRITTSDFRPVFFDFDSYTLREDARGALDANAKVLRDNPSITVTIEGHADERGTSEYNQALGERRAQAARDYLVAAGIATSRIQIISYGKERPFDPGHDESAWAQNRRAQTTVGS
jgi:peptidoglycan-associated lipoprotein